MSNLDNKLARRRVYLDLTHLGRHVTGIERIAIELFENVTFEGADIRPVRARNITSMIFMQQVWLPLLALFNPRAAFLFPGFPPSPWFVLCRSRVVWYVHDLFLITKPAELSRKAKLYMAWPFRFCVSRLTYFFVNSQKTRDELQPFTSPSAHIALYRPRVANVFDLEPGDRRTRVNKPTPLKLVSLGTVEPRKNYSHAVAIRDAVARLGFDNAELHIIGRAGWGKASDAVSAHPNVVIHGYLCSKDVRRVLQSADIYVCTSFDEGLGLPLLEAQYAGLPIFAPDAPVFHEVLGNSGHYISLSDADASAQKIEALISNPTWRSATTNTAITNPERWNAQAIDDVAHAQQIFSTGLAARFARPDLSRA